MADLIKTFALLLLSLTVNQLNAQLSVAHAPQFLLPVSFQHSYFVSQNDKTPPGDLKTLMLQPGDFKVAVRQKPGTSLMYRPHLAFFCRVEVKIDEAVGTPFRFRLGSVDYVDYLEGKRRNY
ncbi:hypothetical protein CEQ90_10570 [Lewinellaceae bacterium SD302]|nr:hypothetical protein CEQ90_10570 [Lewinellaceae bacterium SD302]